jgi:uncharacterized protein
MSTTPPPDTVIAQTRCWLERVVIAHNLCPFARRPFEADLVRYAVSSADRAEDLLAELRGELDRLRDTPAVRLETTLLIHPGVLLDFLDYNDFLDLCDALVEDLGYADIFQIASFHPDYRFAGTQPEAAENYTNRSPYPMLHLIRQASLSAALEHYPSPEAIPQRNIEKLNELGTAHMLAQLAECRQETGTDDDKP